MAGCSAYGSSSEVALFYAPDPDPTLDLATDTKFMQVPMTGESLDASLSSTISDQITPQRSYANSKLSQGEVGGSFSFEAVAGEFLRNMLIASLQANNTLAVESTASDWVSGGNIKNGSTKKCLCFLKRVNTTSGYDLYLFRGCQISSMSLNMEPGNLITGDISIMGTGLGYPLDGDAADGPAIQVWEGQNTTGTASRTNPLGTGGWDLDTDGFGIDGDLMSGVDSLSAFTVSNSGGDMGLIAQSVSLTFDNQLRQQFAVGTNNIFAAGVASGRFMASMSVSAYYSNPKIYQSFTTDEDLSVTFSLVADNADDDAQTLAFTFGKCKITSGSSPLAGGPDQDLLISTEIRAFEDATTGTAQVGLTIA